MYAILTELISGLALFLFGMKAMSDSLQKAAGERLRDILGSVTKNKFGALLFGALFTAIIQSSGATTVMEVSLANAGLMTLEQSIGITFGANIGTTITSQLVSLKLTAIAPFIIFIGAAIISFSKRPILEKIAYIVFGFGSLFLGINMMTDSLGSLQYYPSIMHVFAILNHSAVAGIIGLLVTLLLQSSSVTISVLLLLADSGLVGLSSCLYFILGANIGSCAPAVLASLNSNRESKRVAFIHVMFNVIGMIVISLILVFAKEPVIHAISTISGNGNAKRFVANADTFFKMFQALILLPCSDLLIAFSRHVIPNLPSDEEKPETKKLLYIGKNKKFQEATALIDSMQEIERTADIVRSNLQLSMEALLDNKFENIDTVKEQEDYIDYLSNEITQYLVTVNKMQLPLSDAERIGSLFHVVIDIERIGDHAMNIAELAERKKANHISFSQEAYNEIQDIFKDVLEIYNKSLEMFSTGKEDNLPRINQLEDSIDDKQEKYREKHIERMSHKDCSIETGLIFVDLLIGLERIGDHCTNIADCF
ncbi:MAG: Na/Pi cotransporter family protein [bacterium]|nr:Na/Pi cotransporter family protein [bacterium]